MALKSLVIITPLLFIAMAIPQAKAQPEERILGLINIQGIIYCTFDGNLAANDAASPAFSGAQVQVQCGNVMVSSTVTDKAGRFVILVDPVRYLLSARLSDCTLIMSTPLSTCNASLPAEGGLVSALTFLGNSLIGVLLVANVIPAGFQYLPSL